ncbi:unnamed protein product [Angiostrongylus costaricensis]|uniref:C2-C2_1 domain-containing protein n=1 Tax=Angiostrongylus costaricensis TaxID=334426 RepID=A0A158PLY8_ANGCS|nr:unnamed protein product [Angiostrongylus costaricensis]
MRRPFHSGWSGADKTGGANQSTDGNRTPLNRISEDTLKDKAGYIRLNRLVREKSSQIAEMQYEIDRLNRSLVDLRSQLEQKTSIVGELEVELRNARETTENEQYLSKVEFITKQLAVIEAENEVLKEANERLVKQSLSIEFGESMKEQIELKKQISLLEEKIKDSEHRRLQMEQILRAEKKKVKKNPRVDVTRQNGHLKNEDSIDKLQNSLVKETARKRTRQNKNDNDILERLYQDVAAILESHDIQHDKADFVTSIDSVEQIVRWKKMYAALYDELEKLRNMLLIQHDINQKQCTEIKLLQEGMESSKKKYESKLKEMRDNLMEKQKRILLLDEQIRSIAYGRQKSTTAAAPAETKAEFSTDLSITLTEIRLADEFIASVGTCPAYFLSLEFFDFELQTTPILTKPTATLDFTTIYNVVVSNLFLHFVETNGITIELYSPRSSNYILLAAAVVNLKPLLQKKTKSRVVGELKMISVDSGSTVANLKYELSATDELERCIASYQAAEAALKVLPIEIPQQGDDFEELIVIVNRCTGLDNLKRGEMEVCVIYEFFSFSPYFTNTVTSSKTAEFNSKREWSVPVEALHSYLTETEITFFLFENRPENTEEKDGVLAMLSLPLAPLVENKAIKGTFEMIKVDGSDCGVFLDVNVMWKHGLILPASKPHLSESAISQKERNSVVPCAVAPSESSVVLIRSASTSLEDDHSTVSVTSPKIPTVSETTEVDASSSERGERNWKRSMSHVFLEVESLESGAHLDEGESSRELDRNEIRSLLGNLPPIAKPRLSKTLLENQDLSSITKPSTPGSGESASKESTGGSDETPTDRQRIVVFTDPLHKSIPPLFCLVMEEFVWVDCDQIELSKEDSRSKAQMHISFKTRIFKEFQLSRRRVALLQQWLKLGNRLDFTLVTEGDDSEELAVAQLELSQTGSDRTTTIQFLDINGEHFADLDLVISYSSQIFDCLKT